MEKVNVVGKIEPSDQILLFKSMENPVYIKYSTLQSKCRGVQSLFSQNKNKYAVLSAWILLSEDPYLDSR